MAIFEPKPWVNPFGKMSLFRRFDFLVFLPRKAFFQKHGFTPLEKCQFFDFFELLVFIA